MPKLKTNRAAAKRFKRTKTGKLKRHLAGARHLMTHKSSKRRRRLRTPSLLAPEDAARVSRLLPHG